MTTDLEGRIALVTGASSGIGASVAGALGQAGAIVHLTGRDRERLDTAAGDLAGAICHECELRDPDAVEALVRAVGEVDILVNAAGVVGAAPVASLSSETFDSVMATNLRGPYLLCRALLPGMIRRGGGTIVNLSSVAARRSFPTMAAYAASKAGLLAFSGVLREELREHAIRVIDVIAGATATPIWDTFWTDAPRDRMMEADEVATAILGAITTPESVGLEEIVIRPRGGDL